MDPNIRSATVYNIQKFCTDDGPGIRTTVFLKGCHLRCAWCHNPEGLSPKPVLEFRQMHCTLCGLCARVCPAGVHSLTGNSHAIDRSKCIRCGACVQQCPFGALDFCGTPMTAEEVFSVALADRIFYGREGGITVSGGEPLLQPDFVAALGALSRQEGIHFCVETSGAVPFSSLEQVSAVTDLFLFDIKETDPDSHLRYTGTAMDLPVENLRRLDSLGKHFVIRCPIIPGVNDRESHFRALARLYCSLSCADGIQLMPYHRMGQGKTTRFGAASREFRVGSEEEVRTWNLQLQRFIETIQSQEEPL